MPKKKSTTGPPGPGAPTAPTTAPARPRLSLLGRVRTARAQGLHSSERERLMTSEEGRQAYADARQDVSLFERVLFFEQVVETSLQAHRRELFCYSQHAREAPAAEIAMHKALFTPLIPTWLSAVATIQSLDPPTDEVELVALRDTAVEELRTAASYAGDGNAHEAARWRFDARWSMEGIAHRLQALGHAEEAGRWKAIAADLERSWPSASEMHNVTTKAFHDGVAAGEKSRDLKAIARWLAPVLGLACVEAGLDPTALREVGNTLSRAGGGLPHLATIWPEHRARIQVLADRAATSTPGGALKPPEHGPVFEWVLVRGERYEFFTDRQRRAVQMLWEARGRPMHEDAIRDAVGAEDCDRFRLDHTFRHKGRPLAAWGKIIVKAEPGSRTYRLVR